MPETHSTAPALFLGLFLAIGGGLAFLVILGIAWDVVARQPWRIGRLLRWLEASPSETRPSLLGVMGSDGIEDPAEQIAPPLVKGGMR